MNIPQRSPLKRKLIGTYDLLFLYGRGIAAFGGEKAVAIRSFILVQMALLPLIPITTAMVPPVGMEGQSYTRIFTTSLAHDVITTLLSLAMNWQIAGWLQKRERFWLAMEASAWCSAVFTVSFMLPLLAIDALQLAPPHTLQRIYLLVACYSFICGGCITYAVYRINLFLIIGWAMAGLFIDRESWNLLYALQGLPLLR